MPQLEHIEAIEKRLWSAADTLRANLLKKLKAEKLKIDHWCDKEATRDAVNNTIRDFLWSDETGLLAGSYSEDEVEVRAGEVFQHVYRVYPRLPSPIYGAMTSCQ